MTTRCATSRTSWASLPVNRYPDVSGRPLREALARRWGVAADEILLGNGSEEIISMLTIAFGGGTAAGPARVLFPDPTFNQYEALARAYGAEPVAVPLGPGFELDEARFAAAIRGARPALAFFASPNNPTGNRFDADVLCRLAALVDSVLVVDEAYADFGGGTLIPRVRTTPGLFVTRSLSKIGLAGLRLGALIGPRDAIAELDKVRLPWNVNVVSMALGCATLRHPERLERPHARNRPRCAARSPPACKRSRASSSTRATPTSCSCARPPTAPRCSAGLLARGVLVKNVSALRRARQLPCASTVGTALDNERCVRALRAVLRGIARHRNRLRLDIKCDRSYNCDHEEGRGRQVQGAVLVHPGPLSNRTES